MCIGAIASVGLGLLGAKKQSDAASSAAAASKYATDQQIAFSNKVLGIGADAAKTVDRRGNTILDQTSGQMRDIARTGRDEALGTAEQEWLDRNNLADRTRRNQNADLNLGRNRALNALNPFAEAGESAIAARNFELGIGDRPEGYGGFTATPGYEFRREQGIGAIDASAAARGGLKSGATMKALTEFGDGLAAQEYGNFYNRLSDAAVMGQAAGTSIAGIEQAHGQNKANVDALWGTTRGGVASDYANAQTSAYNNFMGNELARKTGMADARLGILNTRANLRLGSAEGQSGYISNALSNYAQSAGDAAYAKADAFNAGINNIFDTYGAYKGGFFS